MPVYDIFFFGALFFLVGVFLASVQLKFWILVITLILAGIFLFFGIWRKKKFTPLEVGRPEAAEAVPPAAGGRPLTGLIWLAGLAFLIIIGALYYTADDLRFKNFQIPFGEKQTFFGVVAEQPVFKKASQEFVFNLSEPARGKILVRLPL